jgi:hypothetical protein
MAERSGDGSNMAAAVPVRDRMREFGLKIGRGNIL